MPLWEPTEIGCPKSFITAPIADDTFFVQNASLFSELLKLDERLRKAFLSKKWSAWQDQDHYFSEPEHF